MGNVATICNKKAVVNVTEDKDVAENERKLHDLLPEEAVVNVTKDKDEV